MANAPKIPATQLYLILELASGDPSIERLAPVFDAKFVPSLLIVPDATRAPDTASLEAFVAVAQHAGVAVLIANNPSLATNIGADGVHIGADEIEQTPLELYAEAREALGANAIIGVDAGTSRHVAMALGEAGADYVAFGKMTANFAESPTENEQDEPGETQLDIISWWAEIFEIPVVALDIDDNGTSQQFANVRADFVTRKIPAGISTADLRDWLHSAQAALTPGQSVG